MQIYMVGGAVRDRLLGLPISDRDWVVVGANSEELTKLGFKRVGKNFPVFIHPKTKEEYALARTERKTGIGYTGFSCYTSPSITIEEDLLRRDLTINAIAQTVDGQLIDPYHGKSDLKNRLLRHVSDAFIEDPLRILRVARFAAQLSNFKFTIANETKLLMKKMSNNSHIHTISKERIWEETKKALQSSAPDCYFNVLYDCGALSILFPEIYQLLGSGSIDIEQSADIDHNMYMHTHTLLSLRIAASLTNDIVIRFATLCHDLGKNIHLSNTYNYNQKKLKLWNNPKEYLGQNISIIESMCNRLRIPNKMKDLAKLAAMFHNHIHYINKLSPESIINLFDQLDGWRKPYHIYQLAIVCEADASARGWTEREKNFAYLQSKFFLEAFRISQKVESNSITKQGLKGPFIRDELTRKRIKLLTNWLKEQNILPII